MKKSVRILLILIAVACFGVALYYPVSEYVMQKQSVNTMDRLAALRNAGLEAAEALATEALGADAFPMEENATEGPGEGQAAARQEDEQPAHGENDQPDRHDAGQSGTIAAQASSGNAVMTKAPVNEAQGTSATAGAATNVTGASATAPVSAASQPYSAEKPVNEPLSGNEAESGNTAQPGGAAEPIVTSLSGSAGSSDHGETADAENVPDGAEPTPSATPTAKPTPSPTPTATPDRRVTTGAKVWADVEKVTLDVDKILPQYRELYAINNEMVGWMTISESKIDYPVMQTEDEEYYLSHDFFHENNANGLLILDYNCDPYTPSYNLVVSGHNRKNDTIFSKLTEYYQDKRHWNVHKFIQFDSLMEERTYIVFAAFFAANYDEDEEGFRYNANIEYAVDAKQWLREVNDYQLYDTGIDAGFGDEFLTLTTCNSSRRKNGRFVVVARRVRDGETFD